MITVGITGQNGFIGTHLYNSLGLFPDKYKIIDFNRSYFDDINQLEQFVTSCNIIIHLAALNRHNDAETIYNTNTDLVKKLIIALENTNSKPYIIYSSSTQEERDSLYGKSKKDCRKLFEEWALRNGSQFTALIIPNVFGPFGNPFYNSVISTFCYQVNHNEKPTIDIDAELTFIYISELIQEFIVSIENKQGLIDVKYIKNTGVAKVSELLKRIYEFKKLYLDEGIIPALTTMFDKHLFLTFTSYINHKIFYPFKLKANVDERGCFVEAIKLNIGGQVSFSVTKPGITRGNHFHTRKIERFAVIKGKALIELRKIGTHEKISFELNGDTPSYVDMPIWFTHNIKNVGTEDLFTLFWINEFFDAADSDTFFEIV